MKDDWLGQGKDTGVSCPKCGSPLVYNGNNFCSNYGDTCNFAMPDAVEHRQMILKNPKLRETAIKLGYKGFD